MGLWKTRHHSMEMLAKDFKQQASAIEKAFLIIDECIDLFSKKASEDDFHKMCGLVLVKARNYGLGTYSLILDGLGQEAGALARPLIEYHELLIYFRLEPDRVQLAMDDKLPSAGERAKLIEGNFHEYRKYLNKHASHSSTGISALKYLLDETGSTIANEEPLSPEMLSRNMGDIFVHMQLTLIEAINCLQATEFGYADKQAQNTEQLHREGYSIFSFDEREAAST